VASRRGSVDRRASGLALLAVLAGCGSEPPPRAPGQLRGSPSDDALWVATYNVNFERPSDLPHPACRLHSRIDCEIFGNRAEAMARYLAKGSPVFIEGKLRLDQWETQQGEKRSKLKVVIDDFQFVDAGGRSGSAQQPGGQAGQREPSHAASGGGPAYEPVGEDDIPF